MTASREHENEPTVYNAPPCLIAGSASKLLAQRIAGRGGFKQVGVELTRFPDTEMHVRLEESVRGHDAFVIQSTCAPVNEHLVELLILIDTLSRASAGRITAIIPYYGYARQDRKSTGREPITAKLVANLISAAGANRVLSIDLHSPAIQGFFDIGMDHPTAIPLLANALRGKIPPESVIVSPDTGGVKRADFFASLLNLPIAILHKRRADGENVEIAAVIGDVRDRTPIIVDDIIATGGTIQEAVETLLRAGARPDVRVVATHGVFAGAAAQRLSHPAIKQIVVTDSIETPEGLLDTLPTLEVVSIAQLLGDAIYRLHNGLSLSALFTVSGLPPI
ncbi:MAG TPA: ribose-phosphate pyrophosphokinase [Ktedonobacterales bacterium]|nr:ribose-phosphate pyrophosphokinase [Ktedonobacterales bacterium]